ncbi:hypothetical protein WA158_006558 [Blastocystis sp. Blastoise]
MIKRLISSSLNRSGKKQPRRFLFISNDFSPRFIFSFNFTGLKIQIFYNIVCIRILNILHYHQDLFCIASKNYIFLILSIENVLSSSELIRISSSSSSSLFLIASGESISITLS